MRAITLHQPWAWAVAHAGKNVENRTWGPSPAMIGERVAIHAGQKYDEEAWGALADPSWSPIGDEYSDLYDPDLGVFCIPEPEDCVRGAVVAVATLARVVRRGRGTIRALPWYTGPVGIVLEDRITIPEPVRCAGALNFWRLPKHVEYQVLQQITGQRHEEMP
jgi:hypothetical protein